ncbi:MAG: LacI family DNA-binding transcriptional regulator [Verrucomicrobiota bacterium]
MKGRYGSRKGQAVTTRDIAEHTGLSKMTVSRVLNGFPHVSESTRRKVMDAVRDLGFRPNVLAKRFFTGKTRLIGVMVPLEYMFSSFYFKELFQGILAVAEEEGYDILVHDSTSQRRAAYDKCLDLVKGKLVEGLLISAPLSNEDYPGRLAGEEVPLVLVGESVCGDQVSRVAIPNRASSADAVRRLVGAGHRRVAMLAYSAEHVESQERVAGYRDALEAAGLRFDPALVRPALYNRRVAFRQVQALLGEARDVTAIFAANADMAVGALDALRTLGLRIPQDISVVAFDDCAEMEENDPPISAVRQFPHKVGYAACLMLLGRLAGKGSATSTQCKIVETEFVERASIGPAPARRGST